MLSKDMVERALDLVRKDPEKTECKMLEVAVVDRLLEERDALAAHVAKAAMEAGEQARARYERGELSEPPAPVDPVKLIEGIVPRAGERQVEAFVDIVQKASKKPRAAK